MAENEEFTIEQAMEEYVKSYPVQLKAQFTKLEGGFLEVVVKFNYKMNVPGAVLVKNKNNIPNLAKRDAAQALAKLVEFCNKELGRIGYQTAPRLFIPGRN